MFLRFKEQNKHGNLSKSSIFTDNMTGQKSCRSCARILLRENERKYLKLNLFSFTQFQLSENKLD